MSVTADDRETRTGGLLSLLDRHHTVAPMNHNRRLIPPAALAIHLSIGQVYATSVYKASMVGHCDTSLTAVGLRVYLSWGVVLALLAYGVIQTLITAAKLFA